MEPEIQHELMDIVEGGKKPTRKRTSKRKSSKSRKSRKSSKSRKSRKMSASDYLTAKSFGHFSKQYAKNVPQWALWA